MQFAGAAATPESIEQVRQSLGLDKPLPQQFLIYVGDLLKGNLGQSVSTGRPVAAELASRLPASLELTLSALLLSCLIAVPLGVLAATRPGTWIDQLCRVLVTAGVSLPTFFTGIVLIYVFYYLLGVAPSPLGRLDFIYLDPPHVTGFFLIDAAIDGDLETWFGALKQLILPAATLALFHPRPDRKNDTGRYAFRAVGRLCAHGPRRWSRPQQDPLRLRVPQRAAAGGHHARNGLFPSFWAPTFLVEKVFAWPGIGSYAVEALVVSDYAAVQGFVLAMALLFVFLNLLIDLSYSLIDPRFGTSAK